MSPGYDLGINGGLVVGPGGQLSASIGVLGGRIARLSMEPRHAAETIDANGKVVLPGAIDPHVHFRMYQRQVVTSDDYATGSVSAAYGGRGFARLSRGHDPSRRSRHARR